MTVNGYLQDLASRLVVKNEEKTKITTSINTIKNRLSSYFGSDVTDKIVFGSYTRGTILPRKADDESDIDLMVVFGYNSNSYKPQTYLNKLKSFAEYYYSSSEIHQSRPTIVLELNHIKFELVPAYKPFSYGIEYKIPNGPSDWISTNPNEFNNTLTTCNTNNCSKIKPIIRLIKRWNVTNNDRNMKSFEIEKKIAENMKYAYFNCTSYDEYAKEAFKAIRNFCNQDKINDAIATIDKALEHEANDMPYTALADIKEVFEDF